MAISTEPSGEPVADPRPWRAPDVVQPPEDLDERIGRIVAAALARALPAVLAATVNTQGRASPAAVSSAHTQSRPDNCAVQTTHADKAQHSIETAGAPSGLTAAVGRPPRPPAGPLPTERPYQGESDRRLVETDRPFPVSRYSTLLPQDGYATTTKHPPKWPATTTSSRPHLHLPPPPTRITASPVDDEEQRQLIVQPGSIFGR